MYRQGRIFFFVELVLLGEGGRFVFERLVFFAWRKLMNYAWE